MFIEHENLEFTIPDTVQFINPYDSVPVRHGNGELRPQRLCFMHAVRKASDGLRITTTLTDCAVKCDLCEPEPQDPSRRSRRATPAIVDELGLEGIGSNRVAFTSSPWNLPESVGEGF